MRRFTRGPTKVGCEMYRGLTLLAALIFILQTVSCKSQNIVSNTDENKAVMELILQDDHSGAVVEETRLITDEKSLHAFFARVNRTRKPGLPLPEIDFNTYMLLVWCAGETQNPVSGLLLEQETKEAYILKKVYPKKQSKNSAVLSPFLVYKLPLNDKKVIVE